MSTKKQSLAGSGNKSDDSGGALILIGGLLAAGLWVLWSQFHTQFATVYSYYRMALYFPGHIIGELGLNNPWHEWYVFLRDSDKSQITVKHLSESSLWFNGIGILVIPYLGWRIYRHNTRNHPLNENNYAKHKPYNLESFTSAMSEVYPHLALFQKVDLIPRSISEGKYRMGDTEKEFVIRNDLVDILDEKTRQYAIRLQPATSLVAKQLGRRFTGQPDCFNKWEFAVIASLLPRIAAMDTSMPDHAFKAAIELSEKMLDDFWRSAVATYKKGPDGKPDEDTLDIDLTMAKQSYGLYWRHPRVQAITKRHAYVSTLLYSMMGESRLIGVNPPANYRWLRVVDRRLWLIISTVGRQTPFTETTGVHGHYLHEVRFKRPLAKPHIDKAVQGIVYEFDRVAINAQEAAKIKANNLRRNVQQQAVAAYGNPPNKDSTLFVGIRTTGPTPSQDDIFESYITLQKDNKVVMSLTRATPKITLTSEQSRTLGINNAQLQPSTGAVSSDRLRESIKKTVAMGTVITYDAHQLIQFVPGIEIIAKEVISAYDAFLDTRAAGEIVSELMDGEMPSEHTPMPTITRGVLYKKYMPEESERTAQTDADLAQHLWAIVLAERHEQQSNAHNERLAAQYAN